MSLVLKPEFFDASADFISNTKSLLSNAMGKMDSVKNSIDSRVASCVAGLSRMTDNLDEINYSASLLSKDIYDKADYIRSLESKAIRGVSSVVGVSAGVAVGAASAAALGPAGVLAGVATAPVVATVTEKVVEKNANPVLSFFSGVVKKVSDTGAKIVNKAKSVVSDAWNGIKNTGAKVVDGIKGFCSKIYDWGKDKIDKFKEGLKEIVSKVSSFLEKVGATVVVGLTTVASGVTKVLEKLGDGVVWIVGQAVNGGAWLSAQVCGLFDENAKKSVMEFREKWNAGVAEHIAVDVVGELNQMFYEGTSVGRWINDKSYLKYNSKAAMITQNVVVAATEIAAATAITIATGGAGAPAALAILGTGFVAGVGESSQNKYSEMISNGQNPTLNDGALGICIDGVGSALEWYAKGKLGASAVSAVSAIKSVGVKTFGKGLVSGAGNFLKTVKANGLKGNALAIKNFLKTNFTGSNLKSAILESGVGVDLADSLGVVADNAADWINGREEFNLANAKKALGELAGTFALNVCFNGIASGLTKNLTKADDIVKGADDAVKNADDIAKSSSLDDMSKRLDDEIKALSKTDPNYASKVSLLEEKKQLLDELQERLAKTTIDGNPIKSIDLLTIEQQAEVRKAAQEIYEKAIKQESDVTSIIKKLQGDDAVIEGLDYRLKSIESIEDKLARQVAKGYNLSSADDLINDSLRYTLIVDPSDYQTSVMKKLALLDDSGYEIKYINNSWGANGSSTYQGLNVTLSCPDGALMELQFHTPESFNVKQVMNHELYEISRTAGMDADVVSISNKIQAINQELYVDTVKFEFNDEFSLVSELDVNGYKYLEQLKIENLSKIDTTNMNGESVFDYVRRNNDKVKIYDNWDDFVKSTEQSRIQWEAEMKIKQYVDPETGFTCSYEDVIRGYISESDTRPGGYALLNTVNRKMGSTPSETLMNLLSKNPDGSFKTLNNGMKEIEIWHCFGSVNKYAYDPLTGNIYKMFSDGSIDFHSGLNLDGSVGTFDDLLKRVNNESNALNDALSGMKFDTDTLVRRGAGINSLSKYGIESTDSADEILRKLTNNGQNPYYKDPGFMSSSPDSSGGFGGDVQFIITAKEGSGYGNFGSYNSGEGETLLNLGSEFKIDAVKKDSSGKINIFLTQI